MVNTSISICPYVWVRTSFKIALLEETMNSQNSTLPSPASLLSFCFSPNHGPVSHCLRGHVCPGESMAFIWLKKPENWSLRHGRNHVALDEGSKTSNYWRTWFLPKDSSWIHALSWNVWCTLPCSVESRMPCAACHMLSYRAGDMLSCTA